jgi:hypothetical protein
MAEGSTRTKVQYLNALGEATVAVAFMRVA